MRLRIMMGLIGLAGLLAVAGCGPKTDARAYGAWMESYIGRHIDQLVATWGPPQSRYDYDDGRRLYSFVRVSRDYAAGGPVFGFGGGWGSGGWNGGWGGLGISTDGGGMRTDHCETLVTTDRKGLVIDYAFRGNVCTVGDGG